MSAPLLIGVDPGRTTGLALLEGDRLVATHTAKFTCLPAPADKVQWFIGKLVEAGMRAGAIGGRPAVHVAIEQMFAGANHKTSHTDAELGGAILQEIGRQYVRQSVHRAMAIVWRPVVLGRGTGQLSGKDAKPLAIAHCRLRYGVTLPEHEAEAVCIALWGLRQVAPHGTSSALAEATGTGGDRE